MIASESPRIPLARERSDWPALVTVFLLIIGFTYSDDAVEFVLAAAGRGVAASGPWWVFLLDCVLVACTAALRWRISSDPADLPSFLRRLVIGWWGVGAGLVIGGHLVLMAVATHRAKLGDAASVGVSLAASLVFVAAMTMLLFATLGTETGSRSWVIPLVIGTFVAQIASALWYPVLDVELGCAGDISSSYFSDMTNVTSVLLLTVGIEQNYVRRNARSRNPGQRVAPVLTVILLCIALALALSMDATADLGTRCGLAAVWHEYISFVITAQALAIGLSTVAWLLLSDPEILKNAENPDSQPKIGP